MGSITVNSKLNLSFEAPLEYKTTFLGDYEVVDPESEQLQKVGGNRISACGTPPFDQN